jgi:acyl-CoA thioesterase FadM
VRVELRCAHLGHTSFTLAYKVVREKDGVILAEAQTVQVMVDFASMRPRALRPQTEAWLKTHQ